MKAIVYTKYGPPDVLRLADVKKPAPKEGEVLVKVIAVSVNTADWRMMRGTPLPLRFVSGLTRPKKQILGADIAGRVEAVGPGVTQLKRGDEVFGDLSGAGWGGFAEYVATKYSALVTKPAGATFEEAAAVPMAAVTALQGLRKSNVQAGHKVLIHGASGGVGTFSVQLANALGAEVTAVCSARNVDMVRSLGADHVIDYTKDDFAKSGKTYDAIIAVNGSRSISDYGRVLAPKGTYMVSGGEMRQLTDVMVKGRFMSRGGRKFTNFLARPSQEDLTFVKGLIEAGKVKPVIVKRYTLAQVPDAIRYLEEGHAQGKAVIAVEEAAKP
ncbi:MAG: NAD(P)-dependent alcohol dehydrogenase [SAR202 cluster bacterium]|nr:NAD(P)-dependent alcohol dehydrogenase [SAR202 cluster bacterium]